MSSECSQHVVVSKKYSLHLFATNRTGSVHCHVINLDVADFKNYSFGQHSQRENQDGAYLIKLDAVLGTPSRRPSGCGIRMPMKC